MYFAELNKLVFHNTKIITVLDENNKPWFKAKDVFSILKYKENNETYNYIDDKYKKTLEELYPSKTINLNKNTIFINEAGVYCLFLNTTFNKREYSIQKEKESKNKEEIKLKEFYRNF